MSKQAKILLAITSAALLLVAYLALSSKTVTVGQNNNKNIPVAASTSTQSRAIIAQNQAQMETNYKQQTQEIVSEYEKLLNGTSTASGIADENTASSAPATATNTARSVRQTVENTLSSLRDRLLNLTVPEQFKDLHVQLVMALNDAMSFYNQGARQEKANSQKIVGNLEAQYSWLGNHSGVE